MKWEIVDTESAYRRLLAAPDAASREAIFHEALVAPFEGLVRIFGGDGAATFRQWGMWPDQFAPEHRAPMATLVETLAAHDGWSQAAQALDEGRAAFARYEERIPLDRIVFGLFLADLSQMPLSWGYTGFGGIPGWIMTVYGEATPYNLARIKAATAHEMHHNIAAALPGGALASWATITLGEYMVAEGLAESFATELYGEEVAGPWVTELGDAQLATARRLIGDALEVTGFNEVRSYIFGDRQLGQNRGIPDFAGYAVGYRVVQGYLKQTGRTVVEATFVPAKEIIAESRYFEGRVTSDE